MTTSTYDLCFLLIITNNIFGIIGIQTDNIIILYDQRFLAREEKELQQANYTTKPKQELRADNPLIFNGYVFSLNKN
jgi:hypothetical protein